MTPQTQPQTQPTTAAAAAIVTKGHATTVEQAKREKQEQARKKVEHVIKEATRQVAATLDPAFVKAALLRLFAAKPSLYDCSEHSLMIALTQCVSMGLIPDDISQECHINPYKGEAKLILGYRGVVKLINRPGNVRDVQSEIVYANDHFTYTKGLSVKLEHAVNTDVESRGEVIGAWAAIRTTQGGEYTAYMTRLEIEHVRLNSPSGEDGPWKTDWAAMAKKTVLKRAAWGMPTEYYVGIAAAEPQRVEAEVADAA